MWTACNNQIYFSCAGVVGFQGRSDLYHPGEPDEVRGRQMRPLQCGEIVHLQGWSGLQQGGVEFDTGRGVLKSYPEGFQNLRGIFYGYIAPHGIWRLLALVVADFVN